MKPVELDLDKIPRRPRRAERSNVDRVLERIESPARKVAGWRRIVRSLRCDGPQTIKELSLNLVIDKTWVEVVVHYYLKHGIIERVGRSKYRLAEKHADFGKLRPRRRPTAPRRKPTVWEKIDGLSDS